MAPRTLARCSALLTVLSAWCAPAARAQAVDLGLSPVLSIEEVGDLVEVQLLVFSDGIVPVQFSAIDALLDWDPQHLLLVGVDDTLASASWLVSAFLLDPDGINADLTDGDALYTALVPPGVPGSAPPSGAVVTTLQFIALAETPGTLLSFTPTLGAFGATAVFPYGSAGGVITGDVSATATIRIVGTPTAFCFGAPADCPCGNVGGPGEGCANSTGVGARLQAAGSTSAAADDLVLTATQVRPNQFGLFIVGGGQANFPFGDGLRCVVPGATGLHRFNPALNSGPTGTLMLGPGIVAFTQATFPLPGKIQAGGTYSFQAWYRDPFLSPCGTGFNLTNGLQVTFSF